MNGFTLHAQSYLGFGEGQHSQVKGTGKELTAGRMEGVKWGGDW